MIILLRLVLVTILKKVRRNFMKNFRNVERLIITMIYNDTILKKMHFATTLR